MEQPSLALEAPFVDREKEFNTLKALFEQMLNGRGSTIFIVGEGGIGKTRLVREFKQYAESKGAIFSTGSSYEEEGVVPYSPWIDVIRSVVKRVSTINLRNMPNWVVAEVSRLAPEVVSESKELGLKTWLQGPSPASTITPATDQDRIRLFQGITEFLSNASEKRGVVIFLDDIGWADHVSLQLFHYIARRVPERKVLLISAYRDVELPDEHALVKVTLDLNRQRIAQQISLNRFTHEYVSQLLTTHLQGRVSREFSQLIYSKTGGNPFFVEEIVRSLIDQDLLENSEQGWTVKGIQQVEIPTSIRALVRQRISRLGDECVQFLSIASIMGMEFSFDVLKRAANLPEERSITLLETALRTQLVREKKEEGKTLYIFADETIREFLASQVSIVRRRKYHLAIAHAMEEVYGDKIEEHLAELAYHFVQGDEVAKAKEYSMKAGGRAARLYAHSEAMKHYMNALELLEETELETRLDLLTRLGQAAWSRGDHKELLRFSAEAIEIAQRIGAKTRLADLYGLVGISWLFLGNSKKDALESILNGLKVLEDMENTLQEAVLSQQIARVYVLTGEPSRASDWAKRAIDIALKLGAQEVLSHAYNTLAMAPPLKEKDSAFTYMEDALNIALGNNLAEAACRAYNNLASIYSSVKGDHRRAADLLLKGIDYAKGVGYLNYEAWMRGSLIDELRRMGEWEKCERIAHEEITIAKELGELYLVEPYRSLAVITALRGESQKATEFANEALAIAVKSQQPQFIVTCYLVVATIHAKENNTDEAERNLLAAYDYRRQTGGAGSEFPDILQATFELVKLNVNKGRLEKAAEYYRELHHMTSELDERWGWALERWGKGLVAESRGEVGEAIRSLKECVEFWKTEERPYDLARAQMDLGRVLEKAGINSEAEQNFNSARKLFDRLGIPTVSKP